jgi:hypothetical protein
MTDQEIDAVLRSVRSGRLSVERAAELIVGHPVSYGPGWLVPGPFYHDPTDDPEPWKRFDGERSADDYGNLAGSGYMWDPRPTPTQVEGARDPSRVVALDAEPETPTQQLADLIAKYPAPVETWRRAFEAVVSVGESKGETP